MINDCIMKASINVTIIMERKILPLPIDIELSLIFKDCDPYHQAVALERVRFFLNALLDSSIIGSRKNELCHQIKNLTDTPIIECWDEPWDQFIAVMVYYKVTAILEDSGSVDSIRISGDTQAPDIDFKYDTKMFNTNIIDSDTEWLKNNELESFWYHRPDTSVNEDEVKMTWEMIGMSWDKGKEQDTEPNINNVKQFTPRIIK